MEFVNLLFDFGMVTGRLFGYLHQYSVIKSSKSVESFSTDICATLLFSHILRLNFYIFKEYELALFLQSVFMIIVQVFLLHICCKYPKVEEDEFVFQGDCIKKQNETRSRPSEEQQKPRFWRWKHFSSYLICIICFSFITFALSASVKNFFPDFQLYGEVIGLVALFSESVLILPQIIKSYQEKSTKGLSRLLIFLSLSGDVLKLVYFYIRDQPFQFKYSGKIQVSLDLVVILQIFYYRFLFKSEELCEEGDVPANPEQRNCDASTQHQEANSELEQSTQQSDQIILPQSQIRSHKSTLEPPKSTSISQISVCKKEKSCTTVENSTKRGARNKPKKTKKQPSLTKHSEKSTQKSTQDSIGPQINRITAIDEAIRIRGSLKVEEFKNHDFNPVRRRKSEDLSKQLPNPRHQSVKEMAIKE